MRNTDSAVVQEAAGSTSKGASLALPIPCFGFGKSSLRSQPFVSIPLLILLESQKNLKQTPPKTSGTCFVQFREYFLCITSETQNSRK
jgi:hypothetical protein